MNINYQILVAVLIVLLTVYSLVLSILYFSSINENYEGIPTKTTFVESPTNSFLSSATNSTVTNVIEKNNLNKINTYFENKQDSNYNDVNNLPYIIDPQNPNKGYYYSIEIIENTNSPLMKLANKNLNIINDKLSSKPCLNKNNIETVNKDNEIVGYNNYNNLRNGSFANITSIGKSLLSPYISYPVPS